MRPTGWRRRPVSPADAAQAAIAQYDTNHDGVISGDELDKCPALKAAAKRYSNGGDGKITADSLASQIAKWKGIASMSLCVVAVDLDGKPLDGATVTADPETFLGPQFKPATGKTDKTGRAKLKVSGKPGAYFALYKVRVSKMVDGKETIPARYNTNTTLGMDFTPGAPQMQKFAYKFDLKSAP